LTRNASQKNSNKMKKSESKYVAPQEANEVPIHIEQEDARASSKQAGDAPSSKESQEKPKQRPPTASVADFIVSALTGDYPGQSSPRSSSPVPGDDYVMLNANGGEQRELAPLGDSTGVIEEDGKKLYCVNVKLPNYPLENIKVRCHGRNMYVDAKHEIEDSGIYQCHEFHRRYIMPENAADEAAKAQIDDSGVVTVKVPLLEEPVPESRDIPIEQTGQKPVEPKPECENKEMCKEGTGDC
jgi:HSP20 family molecular chaperone IbpA